MSSTDVQGLQGGDPPPATFAARRSSRRRVTKNGNSLTISIPPEFMTRLGILPTSDVLLTLYEEHGGFFVKPYLPSGMTGSAGIP